MALKRGFEHQVAVRFNGAGSVALGRWARPTLVLAFAATLLQAAWCAGGEIKLFGGNARSFGKDVPSPPRFYTRSDAAKKAVAQKLRLFASTADINPIEVAGEYRIPFADGTYSAYSACTASNGVAAPNLVQAWGYNNRLLGADRSRESNGAAHGREQLSEPTRGQSGGSVPSVRRAGRHVAAPVADRNSHQRHQRVQDDHVHRGELLLHPGRDVPKAAGQGIRPISPWRTMFRFIFTDTDDCAGCQIDVGLEPGGPNELNLFSREGPAQFYAPTVKAAALHRGRFGGHEPERLEPHRRERGGRAALAQRGDGRPHHHVRRAAGLRARGDGLRGCRDRGQRDEHLSRGWRSPTLGGAVNRTWRVVNRGDTGALVITEGTPGDNGQLAIDAQGNVAAAADLTVGGKVNVAEGLDKSVGQAVLVAGSATVTTTEVRTDSRIFLSYAGITGQPGTLYSSDDPGRRVVHHPQHLRRPTTRRSTTGSSTEDAPARSHPARDGRSIAFTSLARGGAVAERP